MRTIDRFSSPRTYNAGSWAAVSGIGTYWQRTSSLWNTGVITLCGWVQADAGLAPSYRTIATHMNSGSSVYAWIGYSPSGLCFISNAGVTQFANASRWTSQTVFVAFTADGTTTAGAMKAYARLPQDKTFTSVSGTASATTTMNKIMFANDYLGSNLPCRQWDTRIWDAALTERELMIESLRPGPVRRSNLRGWYPLNGTYGSTGGTALFDYSDDAAHITSTASDVRNINKRYFSVRQSRRFRPLAISGEGITTRVPIWALTNSLRSRQHV